MSTTELLQIPEVREHLSLISVEEYHQFPERNHRGRRTELIRGIIIEKMSKSPRHSWLTHTLYKLITRALGERDDKDLVVWQDQPLTFIDSEPEPDIALVAGSSTQYLDDHPHTALLVIEVAVTSLALDRAKAEIYAEAGIPEYWIIDTAKKRIEVYTKIEEDKYTSMEIYEVLATIPCKSVPRIELKVATLFPV